MPDIKQLVVRFRADLKGVDQGIQELNSKLDRQKKDIDQRYGTLLDGMRNSGRALTLGVTLPIVGIGAAAVNAAVEMESLERGLVAVTGSSAAAQAQLKRMIEVAKMPGLGFKEAIQASLQLQAIGFSAAEAEQTMKGLANEISRVGYGKEEFGRIMVQLTQMQSKGRLLQEDIRFIQNSAPEMAKAMKELYGTAVPEEINKMGVTAKQFILDVSGYFLKLPGLADTAKNSLENLSDTLFRASAAFGKQLLPTLKQVVDEASVLLQRFQNLSPETQQLAIKLGIAAAAAGPLLLGFNGLVTAGTTVAGVVRGIRAAIALKVAALAEAKAATAAEVAWLTTLTGSEEIATAQIQKNTIALRANALASKAAGLGMAAAWIAAAAAVAYLYKTIHDTNAKVEADARRNARVPKEIAEANNARYSGQLAGASDANLKLRLNKTTRDIQDARAQIEAAQGRRRWGEIPNEVARYDLESTKQEVKRLEAQRKAIQAEIDRRAQAGAQANQQATQNAKQQSEEARKLIAENEKANRAALQEKYILSQTNDTAKAIAEARVEYVNTLAEIAEKAKEAWEKHKVVLDVQTQINAAKFAYNAKVKEANEQAKKERAEAQKQAAEERKRLIETTQDRAVSDRTDRAIADAIRRGDEYGKADVEAAGSYVRAYVEYTRGKLTAGGMEKALAEFNQSIADTQQKRREDFEKKQKEEQERVVKAYEKSLGVWKETITAIGEGKAGAAEVMGDTRGAEMARLEADMTIRAEELRKRRREATSDQERNLVGILETNLAAEKQRKTFDILTGGVQSFYDRLKQRKEEAVRGWEQQREAAMRYYDDLKSRLTIGTMDQVWRQQMESGLRASVREPYIPPAPSSEITQADIQAAFSDLNTENREHTALLQRIAEGLERLGGTPGFGMQGA